MDASAGKVDVPPAQVAGEIRGGKVLPTVCVVLQGLALLGVMSWGLMFFMFLVHFADVVLGDSFSRFWWFWTYESFLVLNLPIFSILLVLLHGWLNGRERGGQYVREISRVLSYALAWFAVFLGVLVAAFWATDGRLALAVRPYGRHAIFYPALIFVPAFLLGDILEWARTHKRGALLAAASLILPGLCVAAGTALANWHLHDSAGSPTQAYTHALKVAVILGSVLAVSLFMARRLAKRGGSSNLAYAAGATIIWALAADVALGHVYLFQYMITIIRFENEEMVFVALGLGMTCVFLLIAVLRICIHRRRRRSTSA